MSKKIDSGRASAILNAKKEKGGGSLKNIAKTGTALAFVMAAFFLAPDGAFAEPDKTVRFFNRQKDVFINENCEKTGTCDLKKIFFQRVDFQVRVEGSPSFGTTVWAGYETEKISDLEKYGFVQFIRGCKFTSEKRGETVVKIADVFIWNFGAPKPFHFSRWIIDSYDEDPFLMSAPELKRHDRYRWNRMPGSLNEKTGVFYFQEKPSRPLLYISEIPGGTSFALENYARNSSLEFKICLYRAEDIPPKINPERINFAEPIRCFFWKNSFIYDHDLKSFVNKEEIDRFCLEEIKE